MSKLIERHNKKAKCLVCDSLVSQDAAVVEYRYDGGVCKAFLCDKCEKQFSKSNLDFDDDLSV